MTLLSVQIKKYGGEVLAVTNWSIITSISGRGQTVTADNAFLVPPSHTLPPITYRLPAENIYSTGIDITPAYIDYANEQAKKENLNAKFICQDIRTITFDKEFDVVLNMADGAIGYLEDDGENHKIFSVIVKPLKNGGNPIRLYSLDEITEIFGKLGLRICNSFADFSGKPSSDNDIQLMVYSIRE